MDAAAIDALRAWAEGNAGETLRPTGINARNTNPIFTDTSTMTAGWWGYLVGGKAAGFTSIWTRFERLQAQRGPAGARVIVAATDWREKQKPSNDWYHFDLDGRLLGMAAVARPGRTADGEEYTCYSLVMRPAAARITDVHDRMPLLIAPGFAEEWLTSDAPAGELLDAAASASSPVVDQVAAHLQRDDGALF